jgi:hypothetical protein
MMAKRRHFTLFKPSGDQSSIASNPPLGELEDACGCVDETASFFPSESRAGVDVPDRDQVREDVSSPCRHSH